MTPDVREFWRRIETILLEYAPETAKTVASPATEREIEELEQLVGLVLPETFKQSLRVHNGQNDPTKCHSFTGEGILLNAREIGQAWKTLSELDEDFRKKESGWDTHGFGAWWSRNWVPFTDSDGDSLCLNLSPQLGNRIGEVIAFIHDNPHEPGIAPSFVDWLESLAVRLEKGEFTVEDGYLLLNIPG